MEFVNFNNYYSGQEIKRNQMEKVSTKVWRVQLKVPYEIPLKSANRKIKKVNWTFKLVLN